MEGLLRLVNVAIRCLFLFLATNGASIPTKDNKNGSTIYPESLYLVGMADGKGFFVDNDIVLNWTDAKAYCEKANMQLASITSKAQADMLKNSYNENTFFNDYWTSGRDVLDIRQFIWDNEARQPDSTQITFYANPRQGQLTCLYYYSNAVSHVGNFECTSLFRPLCDTGNLSK